MTAAFPTWNGPIVFTIAQYAAFSTRLRNRDGFLDTGTDRVLGTPEVAVLEAAVEDTGNDLSIVSAVYDRIASFSASADVVTWAPSSYMANVNVITDGKEMIVVQDSL